MGNKYSMSSLYDDLGLPKDCSLEQIKFKYRILAKKYHPDHGGDAETFKKISFAYEILSNPERRKTYDETNSTEVYRGVRTEAINQLSHVFHNIMANFDPEKGDLIGLMRQEINSIDKKCKSEIAASEKYLGKLALTKNKIHRKKENDENVIGAFINYSITDRQAHIKTMRERLEVIKTMIDILENYHYGFLELPDMLNPDINGGG